MLLTILFENFVILCLTDAGAADPESAPKQGLEGGLENFVGKLAEFRFSKVMETRLELKGLFTIFLSIVQISYFG